MDIVKTLFDLKMDASEFVSNYCIVNGSIMELEKVKSFGNKEFFLNSRKNMQKRLYRYYPNIDFKNTNTSEISNYSISALQNNTVYLQSPLQFDDAFDSEIYVDYKEYERGRLITYSKKCGISIDETETTIQIKNNLTKTLYEYYIENGNLNDAFKNNNDKTEFERLSDTLFLERLLMEFNKNKDFEKAVTNTMCFEYNEFHGYIRTMFRISCFTTSPYSQLMWATYADNHKGFCVEYTILPNDDLYNDIYYNLFPLIYCKSRPNITKSIMEIKDHELSEKQLWDIYFNGALRKSIDWVFQNEWRLLLPLNNESNDFNVKFYPITKVYLGNQMPINKRKEIIDICKKRDNEFVGIVRNPEMFEMQECAGRCDTCSLFCGN